MTLVAHDLLFHTHTHKSLVTMSLTLLLTSYTNFEFHFTEVQNSLKICKKGQITP